MLYGASNEPLDPKRVFTDKLYRLNHLYVIRNKDGEIVPFKLNPEQEHYITNRHHRNVNLKARQLGFSTLAVIDAYDDCLFNEHFEAGIIAHSLDDAEKIFNKAKLTHEKLPEWLKKHREPNTDKAGVYVFPNGSKFSVDTSFRGGTLSRLHVSELAKIAKKYPQKAKEIVTGAFEAVPKNGYIDIESTAEGCSGEFYDICQTAMVKSGDLTSLEFKFFFFPWWKNPDYQIASTTKISEELATYFAYLEKDQGISLSDDQKSWYALKKESLREEMQQEYPSYPDEAFLTSGRPVFSSEQIAADIKKAKDRRYELKVFEVGQSRCKVKVFNKPKPGSIYAIGADVAEGLEDGDSSTAAVYDKNFEMCAVYEGKVDPDLFGEFLVQLGEYFNNALLTPELNNHGHATLAAIKRKNYFNIYRVTIEDKPGEEKREQLGWRTTAKSKLKMLDDLKASYRDGSLIIHDEATLRQMRGLTIEEDGNVILNSKDLVVACGLAIQGLTQAYATASMGTFDSVEQKKPQRTFMEELALGAMNTEGESYFD